jgi:glycosyltransferase involved in cell wall biosynthesis
LDNYVPEYRGIHRRAAAAVNTRALDTLSHSATSLLHAVMSGRFDILHLHALAPNIFSRLCRRSHARTVSTVHGLDWQRAKWKGVGAAVLHLSEASMVRNVDRIVVVSRDLQKYYADRYGRETVYIPNGVGPVPEADARASTVLADFGLHPDGYVLYLGRLVPEKRVEDLLLAYRQVQGTRRLVVAGAAGFTDHYVTGLRRLAASDERIIFTGRQETGAVHALLAHATAFVSPSAMEGLPMSLLECMQHGTPAIVSDIPPHRELLGSTGGAESFFPVADVDALSSRIGAVLAAPARHRLIAQAGRLFVAQQHSWPAIAERTEREFYRVIGR